MLDFFSAKIAYAAASVTVDTFVHNVDRLIVNPLITMLFAFAVIFFLYGVFEFLLNQDNEEKRTAGKSHMIWGIVGITIMMGVWVILGIILNTFSITGITPKTGEVHLSP